MLFSKWMNSCHLSLTIPVLAPSCLIRNKISYVVVYHETGKGLFTDHSPSSGRPTKESVRQKMECPELIEREMLDLRKSLRMSSENRMLLLLSLATDDMIRLVTMHPEVWYMDVTGGTNRQKRDLFMMAIRFPTGETFPGNLTILPSGKRWIFQFIYQMAFVNLYGSTTCGRNRLTLCDEDDAEYGPFEQCISTMKEFQKSRLMLCLFHAVWQPFKKEIFPLLPKKGKSGSLLTDVGREWGMFLMLFHSAQMIIFMD